MIRLTRREDVGQLKYIWKTVFGDEDTYIDGYFDRVFQPEYSWCFEDSGKPVAMLYTIPCKIRTSDNIFTNAFYFYALATLEQYRKQGIMGNMINAAVKQIENLGCNNMFLIPANSKLTEYYKNYGFKTIYRLNGYNISDEIVLKEARPEYIASLVGLQWKYSNVNIIFDNKLHEFYLQDIADSKVFALYELVYEDRPVGYAICRIINNKTIVYQYGTDDKDLANTFKLINLDESSYENISVRSGNNFLLMNGLIPV